MNNIKIAFQNLYKDYNNNLITEEQYKLFSAILFQKLRVPQIQFIVADTILIN